MHGLGVLDPILFVSCTSNVFVDNLPIVELLVAVTPSSPSSFTLASLVIHDLNGRTARKSVLPSHQQVAGGFDLVEEVVKQTMTRRRPSISKLALPKAESCR